MHMKRLNAPRAWNIPRKGKVWAPRTVPGAHPKEKSVPLLVVIRDMLKKADNAREAIKIIKEGKVLVDGRVIKEPKFGVGFMDVVSIPLIEEYYRVLYDKKGRIVLEQIDESEKDFKLCKIRNKTILKKGRLQLNLHDGRNQLADNDVYKTGDVIKITIPEQKIVKHIPLEKGSLVYLSGGKHAGITARVKEILPGTMTRKPIVVLESEDGKEIRALKDHAFVIGKDKPEVKVGV